MNPFQALDARYGAKFGAVGDCCSIPIPDIAQTLGIPDVPTALATFQQWSAARNLKAVQLTVNLMMVGRHL